MREIKFRAWDVIKSVMRTWEEHPVTICERIENEDTYWVMQYTGLKDKNVKEIYEGDIVEYFTQKGEERDIVFWIDGLGAWGLIPSNRSISKGEMLFSVGAESLSVIGNIHENPELLRG